MPGPTLDLTLPQSRAFQRIAPRLTSCLAWGRGTGKSWFLRNMTWLVIAKNFGKLRTNAKIPFRGTRVIALMPTLRQFVAVHGAAIIDELAPGGPWGRLGGRVNKTTFEIRFADGSTLTPVPAAAAASQRARGLRGDLIIGDEIDDIERSVFESVARPWFTEPWSFKQRLVSGTPRRGRNGLLYHLYSLGQSNAPEHARYFSSHATYRDCPDLVDPSEVEDARINSIPSVFKREWECDFDAAEGLVYGDVWDERYHVCEPPSDVVWTQFVASGDKGFEDPGVLLLGGIRGHGADAELWILEEHYRQHKTVDWWCERLGEWVLSYGVRRLYFDPSAADWKASYRAACGVQTPDVDNSIDEGVDAVANMFLLRPIEAPSGVTAHDLIGSSEQRRARLYIHPRCKNLIREINIYRRKADPKDPERYTDDIVDKDNHGPDALRYMVSGHFGLRKTLTRQ